MPSSMARSSLLATALLAACIIGLDAQGTVVSTPVYKWDYTYAYQAAKLGDSNQYYGSSTFYAWSGNSGSCGLPWSVVNSKDTAAVPQPRYSNLLTPGFPKILGAACGQCYALTCLPVPRYANKEFCNGRTVKVVVVDYDVPGTWGAGAWPNNHFDLQPKTFAKIADKVAGIINIKWRRVSCDWTTPKFTINSDSNPFWHDLTVYDVPGVGSIAKVYAKPTGAKKWYECTRLWGSHFSLFGKFTFDSKSKIYVYFGEGKGSLTGQLRQTS